MSKLKLLFFAADPHSAAPFNPTRRLLLDREVRQIRQMLRAAEFRDRVEVDVRWAARPDDLLQALNETRPHIVHFSGHGGAYGFDFDEEDGQSYPMDAETLAEVFEVFQGNIQVVVLNACFSLPQAKAIAGVVGCAIGTRDEISDDAAIAFSASFYRAIAFGTSVGDAFKQARLALRMRHVHDGEYPELEVRPGVDATQLIPLPPDASPISPAFSFQGLLPPPTPGAELLDSSQPGIPSGGEIPRSLLEVTALAPPRSGWVFPAAVWMAAAAAALGMVDDLAKALVLSLVPLFLTAALLRLGGSARLRWLTRGRAAVAAILLSAASLSPGASLLNGRLARAKALYRAERYAAALPILEKLAKRGTPEAMGLLGIMYLAGHGVPEQDTLGIRLLGQAAEERDPAAMYALGIAFEAGDGVRIDHNRAMSWYREAAKKGHAEAMNKAGELYRRGLVAGASDEEALRWHRMAAQAGSVDGMVNYGLMLELGIGARRDTDAAFRLYRAAAGLGSPVAMVHLGWMYANGIGRPKDLDQAKAWYTRAARTGDAGAMNNLGVLYVDGPPAWKDSVAGRRWLHQADSAGFAEAAANLAKLGGR